MEEGKKNTKKWHGKRHHHKKPMMDIESIKAEIAAAVESGEITQEEADAKLAGLEERKKKGKKWHGKRHHHKKPMMDIGDIKAKISAAVESGEITQEEASNKFLYLERQPKKVTY